MVAATIASDTKESDTASKALTAIILDDEPANRDFLVRLIQQAKYETQGAASAAEARTLAEALAEPPDLLVIDSQLPDGQGVELVAEFRKKYPDTKLIMATMLDDRRLIDRAFQNGCDVFLVKPNGFMELYKRLTSDPESLNKLIIDNHGIRPYK